MPLIILKTDNNMSEKEIQQQMDAMRALDEPMPQVGIFWFDPNDHTFFGVRKQELTPKQVEEFAAKGIRTIDIKTITSDEVESISTRPLRESGERVFLWAAVLFSYHLS